MSDEENLEEEVDTEEVVDVEIDNEEAPGIVHDILEEAVQQRYSDIYFVPQEDEYIVKVRKKGSQKEIQRIESETANHCVTHLKVLCGMLTYRNNIAQDGVIRSGEVDTEMRVASMPTIHGERISIRLINYVERPVYLDDLNFRKPITDRIREILKPSHPSPPLQSPIPHPSLLLKIRLKVQSPGSLSHR